MGPAWRASPFFGSGAAIDAGIVVLDRDLVVLSWNRWNEQAWGLRADEATGRAFAGLDIGLPTGRLKGELDDVLIRSRSLEVRVDAVDRRGRRMHCRIKLSPLLDRDRMVQGVIVMVETATSRRRAATSTE